MYDPATGMYPMRHRWYDPRLGRFITRDPTGHVDGSSLYQYVQGNPLLYFDPWGLRMELDAEMTHGGVDIGIPASHANSLHYQSGPTMQEFWESPMGGAVATTSEFIAREAVPGADAVMSTYEIVESNGKATAIAGAALAVAPGISGKAGTAIVEGVVGAAKAVGNAAGKLFGRSAKGAMDATPAAVQPARQLTGRERSQAAAKEGVAKHKQLAEEQASPTM